MSNADSYMHTYIRTYLDMQSRAYSEQEKSQRLTKLIKMLRSMMK